jgi:hypothetical protein
MRALVRIVSIAAIGLSLAGCRGQGQGANASVASGVGPNSSDRYFAARPVFPWAETGPSKQYTLAGPSDSVPDRDSTFRRLLRPSDRRPAAGSDVVIVP